MSNEEIKLESFSGKCRWCLEDLQCEDNPVTIDGTKEKLFYDLTKIELVFSPLFSSLICQLCNLEFERIDRFASTLITKQNFLLSLIDFDEVDEGDKQLSVAAVKDERGPETILIESAFEAAYGSEDPSQKPQNKVRKKKKLNPKLHNEYPDNTCPICGKIFTEKRKIPLHIKRIHVRIKDFQCDQCDYAAYTRFDIFRHKKNIHAPQVENPADKRICPDCGKVVRGNNQLTLHIRKKHLNIKKFQCDLCSFASYGKYEIRSHLEHIHIPKEFKESYECTMCSSVLSSAMGLKVHIQHKHSGLKPYSCFCGKSFSLRETLKTHIRNVHKGERKFACDLCSKRFGQAVRLRDHINNNHGTKQDIPCTLCSKIFHSSRNLKAHMIYHDEPKFKCLHCAKNFYLSNKLKEHQKTHEGAEHTCNLCRRTFVLLSSLKRHLKNHAQQGQTQDTS